VNGLGKKFTSRGSLGGANDRLKEGRVSRHHHVGIVIVGKAKERWIRSYPLRKLLFGLNLKKEGAGRKAETGTEGDILVLVFSECGRSWSERAWTNSSPSLRGSQSRIGLERGDTDSIKCLGNQRWKEDHSEKGGDSEETIEEICTPRSSHQGEGGGRRSERG